MIKRHLYSLSVLVCFVFIASTQNKVKAQVEKEIRPTKIVGSVIISSPKRDYSYYALSQKSSTSFKIKGPAKLTVYTRVRIDKDSSMSKPFHIKYVIDGKIVKTRKVHKLPQSKSARYKTKLAGNPTKAKKIVIDILPGNHTINFKKYKTSQKVHVRFLYQKLKKAKWTELKPAINLKKVEIKHLKTTKIRSYYRINHENSFNFSTQDSAQIKIYLREDFSYKMYSEDVLKLELKENGEIVHTYKMTCRKTNKVEYINEHKLMPGTLKKIYIKTDGKTHNYKLFVAKKHKSGIVRIWKSNKTK